MASNKPKSCPELGALLSAYVLDTLDAADAAQIQAHLHFRGGCPRCRRSLAELQRVATLLGESVVQQAPSTSLQSRLMAALGSVRQEARSTPLYPRSPSREGRGLFRGHKIHLPRLVVPLATSVAVILLAILLVINFHISQRMDRLEQENDALSAQVVQFVTNEGYLLDRLHQVGVANYLMASPGTEAMTLEAVGEAGGPQGVLLVSGDGRRAILMVAGMDQPPHTSEYRVWLMRPGQRLSAGYIVVDSSGWGAIILHPSESVFGFDWVGLTQEEAAGGTPSPGDMVLRGRITSQRPIK